MTPILAGNWKMNRGPGATSEFFERFLAEHEVRVDRTVVVFPPALSFAAAHAALRGREDVQLGVQNVHWEESGAFTGELSAGMAAEAGARYALVGHSERRQLFGESDAEVAGKTRAVLEAGLVPVVCVGETLAERRAGSAESVVLRQLRVAIGDVPPGSALVIAYEPVWAIGTGETATPDDAQGMHAAIRRELRTGPAGAAPILYGGSVKPENADSLLAQPDVDGLLVGGASVDPRSFARVCAAQA